MVSGAALQWALTSSLRGGGTTRSLAGVRRAQNGISGNTPNAKDRPTNGQAGICNVHGTSPARCLEIVAGLQRCQQEHHQGHRAEAKGPSTGHAGAHATWAHHDCRKKSRCVKAVRRGRHHSPQGESPRVNRPPDWPMCAFRSGVKQSGGMQFQFDDPTIRFLNIPAQQFRGVQHSCLSRGSGWWARPSQ